MKNIREEINAALDRSHVELGEASIPMKAEEILDLIQEYRDIDLTDGFDARQRIYARIKEIQTQIATQAAERRQLAKHCVIVIAEERPWGIQRMVFCGYCQAKEPYDKYQALVHKPDCLVAKVEAEG